MSLEPAANSGYVCDRHAPRPDPQYRAVAPHTLVGCFVKRAFPVVHHPERLEHMWVEVLGVLSSGELVGRLDNDPFYDVGYVCGHLLAVRLDEIEAVLPP